MSRPPIRITACGMQGDFVSSDRFGLANAVGSKHEAVAVRGTIAILRAAWQPFVNAAGCKEFHVPRVKLASERPIIGKIAVKLTLLGLLRRVPPQFLQ